MSYQESQTAQPFKRGLSFIGTYGVALLLIIFALFPLISMIITSLTPEPLSGGGSFEQLSISNYKQLLFNESVPYSRWLMNSFKVTSISVVLILFISSISGYALARFRFEGRRSMMRLTLMLTLFPAVVLMVALFMMVQQMGRYIPAIGLDTHTGLILVYVAGGVSVNVLLMTRYIERIPMDIDEAALIDGASYSQLFWYIMLPMMRPIIGTATLFSFLGIYGDFVIAHLLLKSSDKLTVMVGLFFMQTELNSGWGLITAGAVIGMMPALFIYLLLKRFLGKGLRYHLAKE